MKRAPILFPAPPMCKLTISRIVRGRFCLRLAGAACRVSACERSAAATRGNGDAVVTFVGNRIYRIFRNEWSCRLIVFRHVRWICWAMCSWCFSPHPIQHRLA